MLALTCVLLLAACAEQPEPEEPEPDAASTGEVLPPAGTLAGTSWMLERIERGGETVEVAEIEGGRVPELQFAEGEEARIAGSDGCNRISGTYTLEGEGQITFSGLISTKMACPGPVEEISRSVLSVISDNTAAYEMEGGMLRLSSGETALHYARQ